MKFFQIKNRVENTTGEKKYMKIKEGVHKGTHINFSIGTFNKVVAGGDSVSTSNSRFMANNYDDRSFSLKDLPARIVHCICY
mmetsp:Transcript_17292/g.19958  ORF Transcript_17292/g.19958 Transcript_17292/m.19958 type:complete len:82 (-) Transcript_17292:244-489(-)